MLFRRFDGKKLMGVAMMRARKCSRGAVSGEFRRRGDDEGCHHAHLRFLLGYEMSAAESLMMMVEMLMMLLLLMMLLMMMMMMGMVMRFRDERLKVRQG